MRIAIPGALADHLTSQTITHAGTVTALDGARRGRGRTLVIEPTSTRVLHVISAYAEAILENRSLHTTAETRAARLWIQRAGHTVPAPAVDKQPKPATCGARRPGWTTGPAIGANRLPCVLDANHTGDHRNAFGQTWPDYAAEQAAALAAIAAEESRQTAELITEAEATDGTWRGQWIGEQTDNGTPGLFTLAPDREQGALFA